MILEKNSQISSLKNIQQETIAPYYLEHNGVAKHDNHTIIEMARSMLYAKNMHLKFWLMQPCNDDLFCFHIMCLHIFLRGT